MRFQRPATDTLRRARRSPFFWSVLFCLLLVYFGWDWPILLPLKWLTVLFHELSHALVGVLTGGRLVQLNITNRESGICQIAGGNYTLFLMAGYPGSLCWGLGAILLARRERALGFLLNGLAVLLFLLTLVYIRPLLGFGFLFGVVTTGGLVALACYGATWVQRLAVLLVGVSSCVYVLIDIQADVFWPGGGVSDATLLARHTGIPALFWGVFWYLLALGLLFFGLAQVIRRPGTA